MSKVYEFILNALSTGSVSILNVAQVVARKTERFSFLKRFVPILNRAFGLAEPVDRILIMSEPKKPMARVDGTLSILSANLWHDWPLQRNLSRRLEAFAHLVEESGADVLLLQEVSRTHQLHSDRWLAKRLGMACVYTRSNGREPSIGFEEGLAVLSRLPIARSFLKQLRPDFDPFVRRLALGVDLQTRQGALPVFSVHLGLLPRHNAEQVRQLYHWVSEVAGERAAIVGGDFNSQEHRSQIAHLQHRWLDTFRYLHPEEKGGTYSLRLPFGIRVERRLDYIFLRPGNCRWAMLDASHLDNSSGHYSDHRAVLARVIPHSQGEP